MTAFLQPGELDQQVTIQSKTVTRNALGEEIVQWVDARTVWAKAMPMRGREYLAGAALEESADVRFLTRYRSDFENTQRLVWRGVPHDIRSIADVEGARVAIEIIASSRIGDAR